MARQTTFNVSLTRALGNYVARKVKSGIYKSPSEVVREGLLALRAREQAADRFWADARQKVAVARRQIVEGKTFDGESAMDEIIAELEADGDPGQAAKVKRRRYRGLRASSR
jgi:putative addiction module CopG family antidote